VAIVRVPEQSEPGQHHRAQVGGEAARGRQRFADRIRDFSPLVPRLDLSLQPAFPALTCRSSACYDAWSARRLAD